MKFFFLKKTLNNIKIKGVLTFLEVIFGDLLDQNKFFRQVNTPLYGNFFLPTGKFDLT